MPIQQVFKKYEVVTAYSADGMSRLVTDMMQLGVGWQLSSPLMCVAIPDGHVMFYASMMQFEFVQTPEPEFRAAEDAPQE